jgi:hypothetical protein
MENMMKGTQTYETPVVTTFSDEEIREELGTAQAVS